MLEFREKPVLCACRSVRGIRKLVESSKRASGKGEFVLLLNYDASLAKRMVPAFINVRVRMADGISRSRSAQMEMLLLVSGTMNIGKALKEHGAKDPERFLAFATSGGAFRRFASENGVKIIRKIELGLDLDASGDVALTELSGD